jgi:hypothetical protein
MRPAENSQLPERRYRAFHDEIKAAEVAKSVVGKPTLAGYLREHS